MTANEFVKEYGWDVVIKLSNEMKGITQDVANCVVCWGQSEWDYLKRLVKSYELVQRHGGLFGARQKVEYYSWTAEYEGANHLRQAIADVEGCL